MKRFKAKNFLFIFILGFAFMLFGCAEDDPTETPDPGQAPELPPQSTFVMDFSDFAEEGAIPFNDGDGAEILTRINHGWAVINVAIWNGIILGGLAIPVAAFLEAFNHEAILQTDGRWKWEYNFHAGGDLHVAELYGQIVDGEVQWEMYISRQGQFEDFLWFSGINNLTATEGSWNLNNDPQNPIPLLEILWHRNPAEGTADISYTNIEPGGPENGGYIFYGITNETPYNAFYDIYNIGQDHLTEIEWDRINKPGQIKSQNIFSDEDWHCWDGNLDDIDCP